VRRSFCFFRFRFFFSLSLSLFLSFLFFFLSRLPLSRSLSPPFQSLPGNALRGLLRRVDASLDAAEEKPPLGAKTALAVARGPAGAAAAAAASAAAKAAAGAAGVAVKAALPAGKWAAGKAFRAAANFAAKAAADAFDKKNGNESAAEKKKGKQGRK